MANEARINSSLQIKTGNLDYQSRPTAFQATVTGAKGPTPGAIAVSTAGTDVDLSELSTPGLCFITNIDSTNYVTYGIWDGATFYPLGELLPGECYVLRLSRSLTQEYGTGTGTTGTNINRLRLKANGATANIRVEAFEK